MRLVKIKVKVVKVGYSMRVAIPSEILRVAGLKKGDTLLIDYDQRTRQITLEKDSD